MKELEQRRWEPQYGVETIDHVESCTWTTLETSRNNPEAVFLVHQTTYQITMKAPVISTSLDTGHHAWRNPLRGAISQ